MNEDFTVRFYFDIRQADRDSLKLVQRLQGISAAMKDMGRDTRHLDAAINDLKRFAAQMNGLDSTATKAAGSVGRVGASVTQLTAQLSAGQRAAKILNDELRKSSMLGRNFAGMPDQGTDNRRVGSSFGNILDTDDRAAQQASRSYLNLSTAIDGTIDARQRESRQFSQSLQAKMQDENANRGLASSLHSVGYEALVVGGIFNRFGVAVTNALVGTVSTAIDYERAFANVKRTTDDGTTSMDSLYRSLIQLSSELPVTFQNLTEIATLGGQLGIAGSGIDEFTSVVARLTATTDLTADAAGTALGRFQALLGVPASEFENLASAILAVGVNSVATETQIVNISTQISSMADFAGFTAEQVVGLAGALASVGAQPELSRGTITRVFTQMSKAISVGGSALEEFARISGVSVAEFQNSFGTAQFAGVFQQFLRNLGNTEIVGRDATAALRDLGITSVRDVPLLLRLSGAIGTVNTAFADAAEGYRSGTELTDQYGIIAETTASKIQVLVNNLTNLIATIGGSTTGPIGGFVDGLNDVVTAINAILATDLGQSVAFYGLQIVAFVGVLATVAGAAAFAAGTFLLMGNAIASMSASSLISTGTVTALSGALTTAGRSAAFFANALKLIPFVAVAAGAGTMLNAFEGLAAQRYGFTETSGAVAGLAQNVDKLLQLIDAPAWQRGLTLGVARVPGAGLDEFASALTETDDALASLVNGGALDEFYRQMSVLETVSGRTFEDILTALPNTAAAFEGVAASTGETTAGMLAVADAEAILALENEKIAAGLGLTAEEFGKLNDSLAEAWQGFFDLGEMVKSATSDAGVSLQAFNDELAKNLEASANWERNVAILIGRGIDAGIIQQLSEAGPEGAALAQALVDDTTGEFARFAELAPQAWATGVTGIQNVLTANAPLLAAAAAAGGDAAVLAMVEALKKGGGEVDKVIDDYNIILANDPLRVYATTEDARNEVNQFLNRVAAASATVTVGASTSYGTVQRYVASGGHITGPGTGTSDSIPARLSNGEYVIRAASVRKYGTGMFDALNRGVARFASGGAVGGSSVASTGFSTGIVELGPKSLAAVRDISRQQVYAVLAETPSSMADYVNRGNRRKANGGA